MKWYRNANRYMVEYVREDVRYVINRSGSGLWELRWIRRHDNGVIAAPEYIGSFDTLKEAKAAAV